MPGTSAARPWRRADLRTGRGGRRARSGRHRERGQRVVLGAGRVGRQRHEHEIRDASDDDEDGGDVERHGGIVKTEGKGGDAFGRAGCELRNCGQLGERHDDVAYGQSRIRNLTRRNL